ncbi:MAG: HAD-IA family hydrolase, partial [Firmicutes bacterium]|nr:HAD-IA family hydrolase [Bacillota bacterium]
GYFDAVFTCSEVGSGKDRPFIYRRAAEHFGAKKEDVLVFEDALHAARTAKNDGFKVAAVFDPSEKRQDELRALADYYIEDLRHSETFWKDLSV